MLWCLAMPIVALAPYFKPSLIWLSPLSCYLALSAGVIAHNHNHCPTFKSRRLNELFGYWLSIFYGYPTFAWIPTHNLNHHKFVNREGDATITWRHTNENHALVAGTYFFVSSYYQSDPIKEYIRNAKATKPAIYRGVVMQYVMWASIHVALFAIACLRFGLGHGTIVWLCAFGVPAFFALWTIMFFNFVQHVHSDPWSKHNHSRSFTSPVMNFLLFNNALHTPHHEMAGAHWSTLPEAFAKIEAEIHPDLKPRGFVWWVIRTYLLSPIFPSLKTKQVGRAPFDPPSDATASAA
jgi:beta-carotene hydroxylase